MNALKEYKPITLVFYIDWNGERNALPLDDTKREAFKKAVENNKMVELEWTVINTFDIKEIRPAEKLTDIEKIFYNLSYQKRAYLNLGEWSAADVDADLSQTGLAGSPTKVKQVENVVFQAKESKRLTTADEEIDELMKELITNHTIG